MRKVFVSPSTKIRWQLRRRLKVFANSRPTSLNSSKSLQRSFNDFQRCCQKGRHYRRPFFFRTGLIQMFDPLKYSSDICFSPSVCPFAVSLCCSVEPAPLLSQLSTPITLWPSEKLIRLSKPPRKDGWTDIWLTSSRLKKSGSRKWDTFRSRPQPVPSAQLPGLRTALLPAVSAGRPLSPVPIRIKRV